MNQDVENSSKALAQKLNNIAKNSLVDQGKLIQDRKSLLDALLRVRDFVQSIKESLNTDIMQIEIVSEDINGWPGFQVFAYYMDSEVGKIVVGAQERRSGIIMFFRNPHLDKSLELSHYQFENIDELNRSMKRVFREFTDEIENEISRGLVLGSFDKSEEKELLDIDLSGKKNDKDLSQVNYEAPNASIYLHSESEQNKDADLENDDLSSLDLFN